MAWIEVLAKLIAIISAVTSFLKDRQLIEAGKAEAIATHLQGALDEIRSANQVKAEVDSRVGSPDSPGYAEKLRDDPAGLFRD